MTESEAVTECETQTESERDADSLRYQSHCTPGLHPNNEI